MKGKFVSFEGCEGVGKSTQIKLLEALLKEKNIDALFLREPGGVAISEKIRNLVLSTDSMGISDKCEALLYSAARAQLVQEVIAPAINAGRLVVCDRFIDSTFAYQGNARGLGFDYIEQLVNLACGEFIPDVTIFLDMPPEEGFLRKGGADKGDRLELEKMEFHKKVYQGYNMVADKFKERVVRISARGSVQEIHEAIVETLRDRAIII